SPGFYLGKPVREWASPETKATEKKAYIGKVKNYYPKQSVAEVKLEAGGLKKGDTIMIQGPTTGVLRQEADSIEIRGEPVERVQKGKSAGVKTLKKARRNDRVYAVRKTGGET
ncbi:MAG: U32 family peptidase, partial [Candidatus Woesearchaeota archaeon]